MKLKGKGVKIKNTSEKQEERKDSRDERGNGKT